MSKHTRFEIGQEEKELEKVCDGNITKSILLWGPFVAYCRQITIVFSLRYIWDLHVMCVPSAVMQLFFIRIVANMTIFAFSTWWKNIQYDFSKRIQVFSVWGFIIKFIILFERAGHDQVFFIFTEKIARRAFFSMATWVCMDAEYNHRMRNRTKEIYLLIISIFCLAAIVTKSFTWFGLFGLAQWKMKIFENESCARNAWGEAMSHYLPSPYSVY